MAETYAYLSFTANEIDEKLRKVDELEGATSITITNITESSVDGETNTVQFSDGKTLSIKNGKTGATGAKGDKPVKGTDYFTASDKAAMVSDVVNALVNETWTFTLEDGSTVTKRVVLG